MQNLSKNKKYNKSLIKNSTYGIPDGYKYLYFPLFNELVTYYKGLIDDIIQHSGGKISFPMDCSCLEYYLSGFKINYVPFDNRDKKLPNFHGVEGFWKFGSDNLTVDIFFNINANVREQNYTKVHELFHFCQSIDPKFKEFFNYLLDNSIFPAEFINKLLDKATDKATVMYLMPNDHFIKKYQANKNLNDLSEYFQVSIPNIKYILRECGQPC